MEAVLPPRSLARAIPRPVVDALLAFVHSVRVLEVTTGEPALAWACAKAGFAHAAVADLTDCERFTTADEEVPGLVLLTCADPTGASPIRDIQPLISQARVAVAPGGVVAVWLPAGPRLDPRLAIVLGTLPSRRLDAVWAFAERTDPEVDIEVPPRRSSTPCAYLVLFRTPPDPHAGMDA